MAINKTDEGLATYEVEFEGTNKQTVGLKYINSRDEIDLKDGSLNPFKSSTYADLRGVVEFGNLAQFAPFEGGYSFLGVLSAPRFMTHSSQEPEIKELTKAFVSLIEKEFKGLDGIEDMSAEMGDITDGITTMQIINSVNQPANGTFTMRVTEKSGALYTKFISNFLRMLKDPRTHATTYGGLIGKNPNFLRRNFAYEVFNLLYIVTDSTMLNVEKAYIIANAQPTQASFSELYNTEKGQHDFKEISIQWNGYAIDGKMANLLASNYLMALHTKLNLNSYNHDYQLSLPEGVVRVHQLTGQDAGESSRKYKLDKNTMYQDYKEHGSTTGAGRMNGLDDNYFVKKRKKNGAVNKPQHNMQALIQNGALYGDDASINETRDKS